MRIKTPKKSKNKWQHTTWEQGDCVYEGLRLKIRGKFQLVGFWFVCGIDQCPSSTQFGEREITDLEARDDFTAYRMLCLQNAEKMKEGKKEINLRVDK